MKKVENLLALEASLRILKNKDQLFYAAVVEPLREYSEQLLDIDPEAGDAVLELEKMVTNQVAKKSSGPKKELEVQGFFLPAGEMIWK